MSLARLTDPPAVERTTKEINMLERTTLPFARRPNRLGALFAALLCGVVALGACSDPPPPLTGVSYLTADGRIVVVCGAEPPPQGTILQRGSCVSVEGRRTIISDR